MSARTRGALVALAVATPFTAVALGWAPAVQAQDVPSGFDIEIGGGLDDRSTVTGELLRVPITIRYYGPPGSDISDVSLLLSPVSPRCQPSERVYEQSLRDGQGTAPEPTTTTVPPPEPTSPSTPTSPSPTQPDTPPPTAPSGHVDEAFHTFSVDPDCNGVYDATVVARVDPPGEATSPGDQGTTSDPVTLNGIRISLDAPAPGSPAADLGGDRRVTVRWAVPAPWAPSAPPDARGYRVDRVAADGTTTTVATLADPASTTVTDELAAAPPGRYAYRVVALRSDALGEAVLDSAAVEASVEITGTTTAPSAGGRGGAARGGGTPRVGGSATAPGQPAVGLPDPGFDAELDYSDLEEGPEHAIPPADGGFFQVTGEGPVGAGLAVPGAVALCLAVWAGHLRHLARRAAPPTG